jgi:peptidyl-prolyl cis-trans isomerase D
MLRGIRKASENWLGRTVMGVVMTLLAGSFAVWGINDIFSGFGQSSLAKIGSTEISTAQFRQTYQDRVQQIDTQIGHPLPPEQARALGLDRQVLGEMIAQAGLDQRAKQMGLGISDAEIARHITTDPNLQTINGQFDHDRFQAVLRNMGYTEQRFIATQRQTVLRRQIVDTLSGGLTPPKAWLDAINQYQNQERSVDYVALGPAQAGDIAAPSDDVLSKYYDDHKAQFRAPEYRKIDAIAETPPELAKWMEISDDDIKKAYDARLSSFTKPERRHIEQIVFTDPAEAQTAEDKIKGGTTFAALMAERGVKEQDADLGTVAKSAIVDPAVADAAFALHEGDVSEPVKGQFGTVILTVLKIEPAVTKTLAEVAPQLRSDLALERAKTQVADIHDKIEDDRAGGMSLTEAAQKQKIPLVTFEVDRSGRDADGKPAVNLPRAPDVVSAAFSSDVGVDNDPVEADGGYIWYDVAAITPSHDRPLADVKPAVEQRWRDAETASRLKDKAVDILDKAKAGTPFDQLAATAGVKVDTASDLKRGAASGAISARMSDAIFRTTKDNFGISQGDTTSQWIVFRVTDVKTPAIDPNSPEAKQTADTVQKQMPDDVMSQYVASLENDLGTSINASVLAQALGNGAPDTN